MTTKFDYLSKKIQNIIFSKVRYVDLIEAICVSQEWWEMAMASYNRTLKHNDRFLLFLVNYSNEVKPKEDGEWTWWMMMEFTKSKSIELTQDDLTDLKMLTEYYKERGIRVRKLKCHLPKSFLINVTESFPYLISLNLSGGTLNNMNGPLLPDGIENLQLNDVTFEDGVQLSSLIQNPSPVKSLSLVNCEGLIYDVINFGNLKYLHLATVNCSLTEVTKMFLSLSKQLTSITLENGLISKRWKGLFPSTVKSIKLKNFWLSADLRAIFGSLNAFVERTLMKFACQDWTKLRLFESVVVPCEAFPYYIDYVCKPQVLEEEIVVHMSTKNIPIGLLDSGNLKITRVKYVVNLLSSEKPQLKTDFVRMIPKSVKFFQFNLNGNYKLNCSNLFENASFVQTMIIDVNDDLIFDIDDTWVAKDLQSLDITRVNFLQLEYILKNCSHLKRLCLRNPCGITWFSIWTKNIASTSLKILRITDFKGFITDVVKCFPKLEELFLKNVLILTPECVKAMQNLKVAHLEFTKDFRHYREADLDEDEVDTEDEDLMHPRKAIPSLAKLQFSHMVLGLDKQNSLSCIMGDDKWFLKRFFGTPEDEFTNRSIFEKNTFDDLFFHSEVLFFRGLSGKFAQISMSNQVTYDLDKFMNILLDRLPVPERPNTFVLQKLFDLLVLEEATKLSEDK